MALISIDFKSEALKRNTCVNVILPIERFAGPYPTLYLLHGLTDNYNGWLSYTRIRKWAEESGLAVVMPSGENSFYMDILVKDGCLGDFGEYVGRELVEVTRKIFPLSKKREDTFLAGLSMGGFGTCRNALKYNDTFGKAAILSGALNFYEYPAEWVNTQGNTIGEVKNFGDLEQTRQTDRNPRYLMEMLQKDPDKSFPAFYVACGLQDELLEANRSIAQALKEAGADVTYEEGPGYHDWDFWDEYIQHVLKWLGYSGNSANNHTSQGNYKKSETAE